MNTFLAIWIPLMFSFAAGPAAHPLVKSARGWSYNRLQNEIVLRERAGDRRALEILRAEAARRHGDTSRPRDPLHAANLSSAELADYDDMQLRRGVVQRRRLGLPADALEGELRLRQEMRDEARTAARKTGQLAGATSRPAAQPARAPTPLSPRLPQPSRSPSRVVIDGRNADTLSAEDFPWGRSSSHQKVGPTFRNDRAFMRYYRKLGFYVPPQKHHARRTAR